MLFQSFAFQLLRFDFVSAAADVLLADTGNPNADFDMSARLLVEEPVRVAKSERSWLSLVHGYDVMPARNEKARSGCSAPLRA